MSDDNAKAMQAVIDSMGQAARAAKARKYAPKPAPQAEPPAAAPEAEDGSMPTAGELEALLNGG